MDTNEAVNAPIKREPGDAELLTLARSGDRAAYARLWERHREAALRTARPLAHADAEDVVSEAFISVWEQLLRGQGPATYVRAYILTVVRNISARWYRSRKCIVQGTDSLDSPENSIDGAEIGHELNDDLRVVANAFASLPPRWQTVLWMTEVENQPRREVAKAFGLTPNSLSVLVRRAKDGLRIAWLKQFLPSPDRATHPEMVATLPRYVSGMLSASRRNDVLEHLNNCLECADLCAVLSSVQHQDSSLVRPGALAAALLAGAGGLTLLDSDDSTASAAELLQASQSSPVTDGVLSQPIGVLTTLQTSGGAKLLAGLATATALAASLTLGGVQFPGGAASSASADESSQAGIVAEETAHKVSRVERDDSDADDDDSGQLAEGGVSDDEGSIARVTTESVTQHASPGGDSQEATEPTTPQQVSAASLTLGTANDGGGIFAPALSGTGEPGSSLSVAVSGLSFTVPVAADGSWSTDLAKLNFAAGSQEVSVTQTVAGAATQTQSASFTMLVPSVSLTPEAQSRYRATASGVAGTQVCIALGTGVYQRISIGAGGTGSALIPERAVSGGTAQVAYCQGARFGAWTTAELGG